MDILAWNIQWGGKSRLDAIERELVGRSPDVIVLGEYVRGATEPLVQRLGSSGWGHQVIPDPPDRRGGVALLSRFPLELRPVPASMSEPYRYAAVHLPLANLELRGVYAPLDTDPYEEFWEAMLESLQCESGAAVLVAGDLNACSPKIDTTAASRLFSASYFERLPENGYTDLWRSLNKPASDPYTWQGRTHPYRLDHAFGTTSLLPRVTSCTYDHSVRLAGLSDHSMLTVSLTT